MPVPSGPSAMSHSTGSALGASSGQRVLGVIKMWGQIYGQALGTPVSLPQMLEYPTCAYPCAHPIPAVGPGVFGAGSSRITRLLSLPPDASQSCQINPSVQQTVSLHLIHEGCRDWS